jgi:ubiquinone/menaquinone biosynthesis C-methylase UbiE/uncharacterized protein YbaR (Trm112 family)
MFSSDHTTTDAEAKELRDLLAGMRRAYAHGENAMEFARQKLGRNENLSVATLIAYDLQAGTYIDHALADPDGKRRWCSQLAGLVAEHLPSGGSIMEVGSGEATTLAGLLEALPGVPSTALGFDISWSRSAHGRNWIARSGQTAELFVADLFHIPLADASVDVVYTSHSLEPNGGRERSALIELLRVARRAVVLVEPIFELASAEAQQRMLHHGYIRNLRAIAEDLGYTVSDYRLLDFYVNPLNPSGVVRIEKASAGKVEPPAWRCPLTHTQLTRSASAFVSRDTGLVYPVLDGIPLLCRDHAVLASAYEKVCQ